jgi:hypothetical protein
MFNPFATASPAVFAQIRVLVNDTQTPNVNNSPAAASMINKQSNLSC